MIELESALRLQGVRAGYGSEPVLKGVDLDLGSGFHVVLGANGAGKTTLFRVLAGILTPSAGMLRVLGDDPGTSPAVWRRVAYVSHRSGFHSGISVRDNLLYWERVLGVEKRASRLDVVITELGLGDLLAKRAGTLSRGQAQRAGIARALLADPVVILLDEPTAGLDASVGREVRGVLAALARRGRCVVCSTHNLYEAAELADDVVLLADGRIRDRGSVDELSRRLVARRVVGLTVDRDPRPVFESLGHCFVPQGDEWLLECPVNVDLGGIVAALVASGIRVNRIRESGNPLDEIYTQLATAKGASDVDLETRT